MKISERKKDYIRAPLFKQKLFHNLESNRNQNPSTWNANNTRALPGHDLRLNECNRCEFDIHSSGNSGVAKRL